MEFGKLIKLVLQSTGPMPLQERRRVYFVNALMLVSFVSNLLVTLFLIYQGLMLLASVAMFLMPVCLCCFYLNHQGYKNTPGALYTGAICLITLTMDNLATINADTHLLLLAFLPLPNLTLPHYSKKAFLNLTLLITFCAVATFLSKWEPHVYSSGSVENQINLGLVILSSFIFTLGVYFSKRFHDENHSEFIQSQLTKETHSRISDLGRMTAGIAHEINNPLAVIKTSASYFLKRLEKDHLTKDRQRKELLRIIAQVERIVKIVNGLGTVSKTTQTDISGPVNINHSINKVFDLCRHKFTRLGIEHQLILPPESLFCDVNTSEIEQVLLSLISNSLDAVENQNKKSITISLLNIEGHAVIKIMDSGEGIPQELKEEILKPFFTTKPLGKGTGLGLSVTSEIINKYEGSLNFDSNEAQTTFSIQLPLSKSTKILEVA